MKNKNLLILSIGLLLSFFSNFSFAMTYTYDALGRLESATNSTSTTNFYIYDKTNNLVNIDQISSTPVTIANFTPSYGQVGEQITINGSGFDSNNLNDSVSFNGTTGAVLSSTTTQMLVQVPVGATTGQITVTSDSNSATSTQPFTVTSYGQPPSISGLSPTVFEVGATVTITGNNLDPISGGTILWFNNTIIFPSSITNTTIIFSAPFSTGTAPIIVSTPFGQASTALAISLPIGLVGSTIDSSNSITADNTPLSYATTSSASTHYTLLSFYAHAGDYKTIYFSLPTSQNLQAMVYDEYGNEIVDKYLNKTANPTTDSALHIPQILKDGYYTIILNDPYAPRSITSTSVTDQAAPSALTTLTVNQYESVRQLYTATSTGDVNIGVYAATAPSSNYTLSIWTDIQQTNITPTYSCQSSTHYTCSIDFPVIAGKTYEIDYGSSINLSLQNQANTPLQPIGTLFNYTIGNYGQNLEYPLTIANNTGYSFVLTGTSQSPYTTDSVTISLLDSNRNVLTSPAVYPTSTNGVKLQIAPNTYSAGNYTIRVNPTNGDLLTGTIDVLSEPIMSVNINDPATNYTASGRGQAYYFQFTTTATENIGITEYSLSSPQSGANALVSLNGSSGFSQTCIVSLAGCDKNIHALPAGTYLLSVDGNGYQYNFTQKLTQDYDSTISFNTYTNTNLDVGRNQEYDFTGNVGDEFALIIDQYGTSSNTVYLGVYNSSWVSSFVLPSSGDYYTNENQTFNFGPISTAGTYTVFMDTSYNATLNNNVLLDKVTNTALTVNATATNLTSDYRGVNIYANFAGTSGEGVTIHVSGVTIPVGTQYTSMTVYNPSGVQIGTAICTVSSGCTESYTLSATGTYTIKFANLNITTTSATDASNLALTVGVTSP